MMDDVYEIVMAPKGGSTGQALVKILKCLDLVSRFSFAVVADVECNENRRWVQQPPFSTTTQEVLEYAVSVGQFDRATFFFFMRPLRSDTARDFDTLFAEADLVIRAVDDTSFYVYSFSEADAARLLGCCPVKVNEKRRDAIVHPA